MVVYMLMLFLSMAEHDFGLRVSGSSEDKEISSPAKADAHNAVVNMRGHPHSDSLLHLPDCSGLLQSGNGIMTM